METGTFIGLASCIREKGELNLERDSRIYVAGHRGLVGSAIVRYLQGKEYTNIIGRSHDKLDLTDQTATGEFFAREKPDYVFLAAARVGGIAAHCQHPADFLLENQLIQSNVISSAYMNKVKKLLFFGSSAIYPRLSPQPIKEEYLLAGPLEPTNEGYALAKISGLKMCQYFNKQYGTNYISIMLSNVYGPHDKFDLENAHVFPAMMRRIHEAKVMKKPYVELWGTGNPVREFLYADDMADACIFLMDNYEGDDYINVGTGKGTTIRELAEMMKGIIGYGGDLKFDPSRPDGTPSKLLDVGKMTSLGWKAGTGLFEGIELTYKWFVRNCWPSGSKRS